MHIVIRPRYRREVEFWGADREARIEFAPFQPFRAYRVGNSLYGISGHAVVWPNPGDELRHAEDLWTYLSPSWRGLARLYYADMFTVEQFDALPRARWRIL